MKKQRFRFYLTLATLLSAFGISGCQALGDPARSEYRHRISVDGSRFNVAISNDAGLDPVALVVVMPLGRPNINNAVDTIRFRWEPATPKIKAVAMSPAAAGWGPFLDDRLENAGNYLPSVVTRVSEDMGLRGKPKILVDFGDNGRTAERAVRAAPDAFDYVVVVPAFGPSTSALYAISAINEAEIHLIFSSQVETFMSSETIEEMVEERVLMRHIFDAPPLTSGESRPLWSATKEVVASLIE
jgi:hypothetical protein